MKPKTRLIQRRKIKVENLQKRSLKHGNQEQHNIKETITEQERNFAFSMGQIEFWKA